MNFKIKLLSVSMLTSFLLTLLLHSSWSINVWLDELFLVGLLLVVIGSTMLLIEGQFFTAFFQSFKYFVARVSKKEQIIRTSEKRTMDTIVYQKSFPSRKTFLEIGIILCIFSFLVSTTIYYLGR